MTSKLYLFYLVIRKYIDRLFCSGCHPAVKLFSNNFIRKYSVVIFCKKRIRIRIKESLRDSLTTKNKLI